MKIRSMRLNKLLLGMLFIGTASQAFAVPNVTCSSLTGICTFSNLQRYDEGKNPHDLNLAALFICDPNPGTRTFRMINGGVLITGFDNHGRLWDQPVSILQKYQFAAYLDPKNQFLPTLLVYDQDSRPLSCRPGYFNPNSPNDPNTRPIMPGEPQFSAVPYS